MRGSSLIYVLITIKVTLNIIIGVASIVEYAPNRIEPDGSGKTKQYTVYNRRTQLAQLKLDDDEGNITVKQPLKDKIKEGDYYEMKALRHGTVLIINNKNFVAHSERTGTDRDEYNLIQTFYFLGYRPIVCNNLNSADIHYIFENLDKLLANGDARASAHENVEHDSFVCCILTHGDERSIFGSDSNPVSRDDIEKLVGRSKRLSGKPKIFFMQACRGGGYGSEPTDRVEADNSARVQPDDSSNRADVYVCTAAVSGDQSYRDKFLGSWFIFELCKILCEFGSCKALFEVQSELNKVVTKYTYKAPDGKEYKQQTSCSTNTLHHDVHFFCK